MSTTAPQGQRRLRTFSLAAASALLLAAVAAAPASGAAPSVSTVDNCESFRGAGDNFAELCVEEGEAAALAEVNAIPGIDEIASSPNLRQIANVPKFGAFNSEASLNSDLAFQGNYAFAGNYNGFVVFDVSDPRAPQAVSQVVCPGQQGDPSVYGNLLFLSVDQPRTNDSCGSAVGSASEPTAWEGMRIFDISDKANPRYIKSVRTDCGSHTHTLVPSNDGASVYIYVSSYSPSLSNPNCQPPHDKISIIEVPLGNPTGAAVVATPNLFSADSGGNPGGNGSSNTTGCHDITAYPEKNLAAGACMGDGILMDISDRKAPRVLSRVRDNANFSFWHSATFNNAGTKVVFTDELGGGSGAICTSAYRANQGADAIYDIAGSGDNRSLVFKSYFKIPRLNTTLENCVAHNGSLIPAMGRDVLVQAWYQGGVSVWDFTDSANPVEIGYWERGPLSDTRRIIGGAWSTYYHNGYIYSNDIQKGFDVLQLTDPRTDNARAVYLSQLNVQTQPSYPVCTTVLTNRENGGMTITSGVTCLDGVTVNGAITVAPGAGLIAFKSTLNGSVSATGASVVSIVESQVNGPVTAPGGIVRDSTVTGTVTTN